MVAEGIETQQSGYFDCSGTGLVRTGSREMADDVGSKEKFVADNGSIGSEDWLASGVFYGPNFDVDELIHWLHSRNVTIGRMRQKLNEKTSFRA
jgi:hypothetical protein